MKVKNLIVTRRKAMKDVRDDVFSFLDKHKFSYVPSVSNKFMVDTKRPGDEIVTAMRKEKVYIGRVWKTWPTHVRVSVGTKEEMAKFRTAFKQVMDAPPAAETTTPSQTAMADGVRPPRFIRG